VQYVSPYLFPPQGIHSAKYKGNEVNGVGLGGTEEGYSFGGTTMKYGRFFSDLDNTHHMPVAVVGEDIQKQLVPNGDPIDKPIEVDGHEFRILGVMDRPATLLPGQQDLRILLPYLTMHKMFPNAQEHMLVSIAYPGRVDQAEDEIRAVLRLERRVPYSKPDTFSLTTAEQMIERFHSVTAMVVGRSIFTPIKMDKGVNVAVFEEAGKVLASMIIMVGIISLYYLVAIVSAFALTGGTTILSVYSYLLALLYGAAAIGIGYLISAIMKGATAALVLTFAVLLLIFPVVTSVSTIAGAKPTWSVTFAGDTITYILQTPYPTDVVVPGHTPIQNLTKYHFFPDVPTSIGVMLGYTVVTLGAALIVFKRRELLG
jgi:hypothetical protein